MKIPEDYNTRAEAMWRIISQRVDFRKKLVCDYGCGHGEMLWRVYIAGADMIWGCDKMYDDNVAEWELHNANTIFIRGGDILDKIVPFKKPDIAICFSVLPYLDEPLQFIQWMAETFPICLIEAQYEPEPYNIGVSNDEEMFRLLRDNGFEIAIPLGKTYIEIRDTYRSIFYCTREKKPLGVN